MHAVREALLQIQARAAGLPLITVPIPSPCSNEVYEAAMAAAMQCAREEGVTHVAFGDLFLEDIRRYREEKLATCDITPVFPIWRRDTRALAKEMLAAGLRAIITCVDPTRLSREFAGKIWDESLVGELPPGVDPCGENGEFHTFAFAGPMFLQTICLEPGQIVERDGFAFADVLPCEGAAPDS
jgi:diphthamide synthase (EF-2-diphthine--ammonia ligase)